MDKGIHASTRCSAPGLPEGGLEVAPNTLIGRKSVEWYTPPWIFERLGLVFDLDPCSPIDFDLPWIPAKSRYTVLDNGLSRAWNGRVWLNPPYGTMTELWMKRMAAHGSGVALVFSRTDTTWFQDAISSADAVLFVAGRIQFVPGRENLHKRSRCGAASVLLAWGREEKQALRRMSDIGAYLQP